MSGRPHTQTTLAHTFQPLKEVSLHFALITPTLESCSSPSTPSPKRKSFALHGAEDDADHLKAWLPHSLLLQPQARQATANGSIAARSQRRPFWRCPSTESFHRAPILPYFPCSPSVTRSVLVPRPSALGVLLRFTTPAGQVRTCRGPGFRALRVSAFRKSFVQRTQKTFSEPSEKDTPTALGSGAHSRRFAQECPEGNPGKFKQEKFQWHFMKTTSR